MDGEDGSRGAPTESPSLADAPSSSALGAPGSEKTSPLIRLGPGLITGAADDDPSGIATYSQAGAAVGYGLLWSLIVTYPLMVGIQVLSARVGRVTGRGLAANIAAHSPRWIVTGVVTLLFAANTINIAADLAAMGDATKLVFGGHSLVYAVAFAIGGLLVQIYADFALYSRILKLLTLVLLAYVAAAFVSHIAWKQALLGTVLPHFRLDAKTLGLIVAIFGTTISPYMFFWQATQEVEDLKTTPGERPLKRARRRVAHHLRRIRIDTQIGMAISNVVGFFIMLTAAASLHRAGVVDIQSASQAAEALRPIAGKAAFYLFAVGIVGTGLLAVPVLAGSSAYAVAEALGWKAGLGRALAKAPGFYAVLCLGVGLAIGIDLAHIDPIKALVTSAIINGIIAVPIMAVLVRLASRRDVMGHCVASPKVRRLGWAATAVMAIVVLGMLGAVATGQ